MELWQTLYKPSLKMILGIKIEECSFKITFLVSRPADFSFNIVRNFVIHCVGKLRKTTHQIKI